MISGHETKAMLNNGGPRYKRSRLERQMNTDVIWCVIILLVLCCLGAIGCKLWLDKHAPAPDVALGGLTASSGPTRPLPPYIPTAWEPAFEGLLSFWTFIIILQVNIFIQLCFTSTC
jgi:phospholipid-translocating ATPase